MVPRLKPDSSAQVVHLAKLELHVGDTFRTAKHTISDSEAKKRKLDTSAQNIAKVNHEMAQLERRIAEAHDTIRIGEKKRRQLEDHRCNLVNQMRAHEEEDSIVARQHRASCISACKHATDEYVQALRCEYKRMQKEAEDDLDTC